MFQTPRSMPTALTQPTPTDNPDEPNPIRHILIGSPALVKRTIHQLHQAHYAETFRWTHPIEIPEGRVILTPNPGEVMGLLVKLVRLG
ncbi:hypothetical protein [Almyronema epifaneia]|uniref:Uncharacterized protein n=1 Tax=Almyronema epifaneia S1 TaxID=2991925 RepID=A0ABW6IDL6_9CYAN